MSFELFLRISFRMDLVVLNALKHNCGIPWSASGDETLILPSSGWVKSLCLHSKRCKYAFHTTESLSKSGLMLLIRFRFNEKHLIK